MCTQRIYALCREANAAVCLTRIQCRFTDPQPILLSVHYITARLVHRCDLHKQMLEPRVLFWAWHFLIRGGLFALALHSVIASAAVEARSLCSCMNVASEPTLRYAHCITRMATTNASFRGVRVRDASQHQASSSSRPWQRQGRLQLSRSERCKR